MTTTLHLVVPGEPVPKARPRVVKNRAFTPARTRAAENRLLGHLKAAYPSLKPVRGPCDVSIDFHLGTARRVDVDNLTKLVLDVGNRRIWADDSQIHHLEVHKYPRAAKPRTELWVLIQEAP